MGLLPALLRRNADSTWAGTDLRRRGFSAAAPWWLRSARSGVILLSLAAGCQGGTGTPDGPSFQVTLAPAAVTRMAELGLPAPIDGRMYVVVSRDSVREPRRQVGVTGVPFWGLDVHGLEGGGTVTLAPGDSSIIGYPLPGLEDLPGGTYYVEALLNVYTTFQRSDGRTVQMHQETGAGQDPWNAPGNVHSRVQRIHIAADQRSPIALDLAEVIPPLEPVPPGGTLQQGNPADGELVRFVKIRSQRISEFWGRDMFIGANVLLPRDWSAHPQLRYPVIYLQGHFPGRSAPFGFTEDTPAQGRGAAFRDFWLSAAAPRVIVVTIRDANPFYDTSYSVNSANVGPYGDAITEELMPYVEKTFRGIGEPWARVLAGGSTGGWEALAMQVWYPDLFGGAWGWCPDPVDFHYYQIVDVYHDDNAYYRDRGWLQVARPGSRRPDGNVQYTMGDENAFERAVGPQDRSAGQWAIWEAVFSPVGADGYPARIWDPVTGEIDHQVAAYWQEHYDINHYLQQNWNEVGPKLAGKLHVAVGDMDTYYLDDAVYLLQQFLDATRDPPARASFEYGRRQPHCWTGYSPSHPGQRISNAEFVREAYDYMMRRRAN